MRGLAPEPLRGISAMLVPVQAPRHGDPHPNQSIQPAGRHSHRASPSRCIVSTGACLDNPSSVNSTPKSSSFRSLQQNVTLPMPALPLRINRRRLGVIGTAQRHHWHVQNAPRRPSSQGWSQTSDIRQRHRRTLFLFFLPLSLSRFLIEKKEKKDKPLSLACIVQTAFF